MVGDRIKKAREAAGLGQKELATMVGMNQSFLSQVETGRRGASIETLDKIARALKIPPSSLMEEDAPSPRPPLSQLSSVQSAADFEEFLKLVASEHPDIVLYLRSLMGSKEKLSQKDIKFLADSLLVALGQADETVKLRKVEGPI